MKDSRRERIWLQLQSEDEFREITWCEDKINHDDVEYVRADKVAQLKAENKEARKMFPMQDGPPVTWIIAEMIYELYSAIYPPPNQSLERLGERGGFGWAEVKLLRDKYRRQFGYAAFDQLTKKWVAALLKGVDDD